MMDAMSFTSGDRPKVLVVACGGTISSVRSAGAAGATPTLSAEQLVAEIPELAEIAGIEAQTASILPSPHMTLAEVLRLVHRIEEYLAEHGQGDDGVCGVVVTHGTDTLEEVAFALDLLWRHPVPLVVTGAMRNASQPGADGPANLIAAATTAVSDAARGLGVLVVFNDQIHAARFVRKSHTANVATFQSPSVGPIGYLAEGVARIVFAPRFRQPLEVTPTSIDDVAVALVKMSIGDDGRLLAQVGPAGYQAVVIEGFGGGHVTREIAESQTLESLLASMPVVLSSRAGSGEPLRNTYSGFAGSEVDMTRRGVISSGVLDGPKSRVLLSLLLANRCNTKEIRQSFGEQGLYGSST
jgi:L-asparaginase